MLHVYLPTQVVAGTGGRRSTAVAVDEVVVHTVGCVTVPGRPSVLRGNLLTRSSENETKTSITGKLLWFG